jgi:hypothetical protein
MDPLSLSTSVVLASMGSAQANVASAFSLGVLKKSLEIDTSSAAQLVQAMNSGPGIDLTA